MADTKAAKTSKSKSKNKSTKLSSQNAESNISTVGPSSGPAKKPRSSIPGSILDKLDLEHLKETTLKNMKAGIQSSFPPARDACIEYALEMVIGNLILNGHLDPKKAQQMRNPQMKSQIASICDDMISAKAEISMASTAIYTGPQRKSSKSSSKQRKRSKQKQRWALQPAALPITIVTDQSLSKLPKFTMIEKINMSMNETGSVKSFRNVSVDDDIKKRKSGSKHRSKSLDSSSERSKPPVKAQESRSVTSPPPTQNEGRATYQQQDASSEVPSNHSLENNAKLLSSSNNVPAESNANKQQTQASEGPKQVEDNNKNVVLSTSNASKGSIENTPKVKEGIKERKEEITFQPPPHASSSIDKSHHFTPMPITACTPAIFAPPPSTTRTLNTFLNINNSNCSLISTATISTGYHMLVDMKGFQNDEISMEVEGRQLIFLASRPKRDDLNLRKVTEIVEVPGKVNMENLKIGRRIDGYVLIEEHDQ